MASPSNVPVAVLNAGPDPISVSVNSEKGFRIAGLSFDGTPSLGDGGTTFNSNGPAANAFGPGTNQVRVTPFGSTTPMTIPVSLPVTIAYESLQMYFFSGTVMSSSWLIANDGQVIASSFS